MRLRDRPALELRRPPGGGGAPSATAEDLPGLSFAGQQETYLNIHGLPAVLAAVKRCWASLWTGRAIGYRLQHGIDHSKVSQAVVVQVLVPAEAAGILFTANPVTGQREQAVISASWGMGEAIVGAGDPDTSTVDDQWCGAQPRDRRQTVMTVSGEQHHRAAVPKGMRRDHVRDTRLGLVSWGTTRSMGPMDIEWAVAERRSPSCRPGRSPPRRKPPSPR
jgi:pyruvate,water dikinase